MFACFKEPVPGHGSRSNSQTSSVFLSILFSAEISPGNHEKKTSEQKKTKQQQNGPILVWTLLSYYQFSLMSAVSSSVIPKNHAGLFSICLSHCSDSIENHRGTKFCLRASIKFQAHFTLKQ